MNRTCLVITLVWTIELLSPIGDLLLNFECKPDWFWKRLFLFCGSWCNHNVGGVLVIVVSSLMLCRKVLRSKTSPPSYTCDKKHRYLWVIRCLIGPQPPGATDILPMFRLCGGAWGNPYCSNIAESRELLFETEIFLTRVYFQSCFSRTQRVDYKLIGRKFSILVVVVGIGQPHSLFPCLQIEFFM